MTDSVPMQKQHKNAFLKFCEERVPRTKHQWKWGPLLEVTRSIRDALKHMDKEQAIDLQFVINLNYDKDIAKVMTYTVQQCEHNIRIVDVEKNVKNNKRKVLVISSTHSSEVIKEAQKLIGQQFQPLNSSTRRSRDRRERFKAEGYVELRGVWLKPEQKAQVEAYIATITKEVDK